MQTHTNSTYPKGDRESGVRDDWPSANMLVLSFCMLYIIRVLSYEDFITDDTQDYLSFPEYALGSICLKWLKPVLNG